MTKSKAQTLGQRIDAMLEPLYEEAEQHRATISIVNEQQVKLQQQKDAAEQGLSQIETRMAAVVRAMAQEEPVIAAVVGESAAAVQTAEPAETIDATPGIEPATEAATQPAPEDDPEVTEPEAAMVEPKPEGETEAEEPVVADTADATEAIAEVQASEPSAETAEDQPSAIELDPEADAAAVEEAAAMLETAPPQEAPKMDLTAAAERAAAAAKQLREKTGSN